MLRMGTPRLTSRTTVPRDPNHVLAQHPRVRHPTKVRQEFEKHRYVSQLNVVDVLLYQSHAEFQETLNFWKQLSHVMKYFRPEEDPGARLPRNFVSGFLEGRN